MAMLLVLIAPASYDNDAYNCSVAARKKNEAMKKKLRFVLAHINFCLHNQM